MPQRPLGLDTLNLVISGFNAILHEILRKRKKKSQKRTIIIIKRTKERKTEKIVTFVHNIFQYTKNIYLLFSKWYTTEEFSTAH